MLVVAGAELLFEGLLGLAARFRMPAFAVTAVVSGLEAENLVAGIAANAKGLPGAAAGTFLGGTTFIALAVAGIAGVASPLKARLPTGALVCTAVSPLGLVALSADGRLSRLDGIVLIAWFALAIWGLARFGPRPQEPPVGARRRWPWRLAAGLALLAGGGEAVGEGIRRTVSDLGVSQTLLGNTAVAASVEAEELGRVAAPARRGRPDLALANLTGTIVHFVALNAGVIALVRPLPLGDTTLHFHLPVAVVSALVLPLVLALEGGVTRRAGLFLAALYVGYVAFAIALS